MNDPRSMNSQLDGYVIAALERFAELAPGPEPWPLMRRVDPPVGDGRKRWVASAAAAAVGVGGMGAIIAVTGNDTSAPVIGAPDSVARTDPTTPTTVVTTAATSRPLCGTAVPALMAFEVPFTGPVETAGDALVQRWEFQGGALELTWPASDTAPTGAVADAAVTRFEWTAGVGDEGVPFIGIDVGGDQAASPGDGYGVPPENFGLPADFAYDVVIGLGFDGEVEPERDASGVPVYVQVPACDVMQLDIQDATGNVERWLISLSGGPQGDDWSPTFVGATVETRTTAVTAPRVFADAASGCNTVSGVPFGEPDLVPEPIAALARFIISDQGRHFALSATGWEEVDDTTADRYWYVQRLDFDSSAVAAAITVERSADGWAVSAYELTCG